MKIAVCITCIIFLTNFHLSFCSLTINGSVSIHSFIFKKVINAFDYVLVKFDEPFSYGENEEVYKEIAKVSIAIPNLLTATVGIADYGEKENADLAEMYKITKADFPAYRLFKRDIDNPIIYKGPIKTDDIKSFIVKHTGAYLGLDGCLEQFDLWARQFVSGSVPDRAQIMSQMSSAINDLANDKSALASAEKYLKIAEKIQAGGREFVTSEQARLRKLSNGNISDNKKIEIKLRLNILQSFDSAVTEPKSEL